MILLLPLLAACGPQEPIRIGFVGALSGRFADLGEAGRNGAQFAVEERNRQGGINGRPIELLIRDDAQGGAQAVSLIENLAAAGVEAIIGPMTSAMAEVMAPAAQKANVLLVSPTVTARQFYGRDDALFLVMPSTTRLAGASAEFMSGRKNIRRVAVIYDERNQSYTLSWLKDFTAAMQAKGGSVTAVSFDSSGSGDYPKLTKEAVGQHPDAVLFLTSALDTARLAQHLRVHDEKTPLYASMWAATESLTELGGRAVEGVMIYTGFDRASKAPEYAAFKQAFQARFHKAPDFAGTAGYDAAAAVLEAIARRGSGGLKQSLLSSGPFAGAQGPFSFDAAGDSERMPHIAIVRDGQLIALE